MSHRILSSRTVTVLCVGCYRCVRGVFLSVLMIAALAAANLPNSAWAVEPSKTDAALEDRVKALIPELEAYTASGMKAFDVPGLAMGIVAGDKLVYVKGFGVRRKAGGAPVDTRTVFQIGSNTKAFLTTLIAFRDAPQYWQRAARSSGQRSSRRGVRSPVP